MIVCNKCGQSNVDEERLCRSCGHKLQSLRGQTGENGDGAVPPASLADERIGYRDLLGQEGYFRKHLEAWICLAALGGAAVACVLYDTLWPLGAAIPAVALLAWLRKL